MKLRQLLDQLYAVHLRHHQVGQQKVIAVARKALQGGRTVPCQLDFEPSRRLESGCQILVLEGMVLDY